MSVLQDSPLAAVRVVTALDEPFLIKRTFSRLARLNGSGGRAAWAWISGESDSLALRLRAISFLGGEQPAVPPSRKSVGDISHAIIDLCEDSCGKTERDGYIRQVWKLVQQNSFANVSERNRSRVGCIYHTPKTLAALRKRIDVAQMFFVLIREEDSRVLGFSEITKDRLKRLHARGRIRHPHPCLPALLAFEKKGQLLHEQLIVADKRLRISGVGRTLLDHAFRKARRSGIRAMTTEIQVVPLNNKSVSFHASAIGYRQIGSIVERPRNGSQEVNFTLFAKGLTPGANRLLE